MRLSLGYPDREFERLLLTGGDRRSMLTSLKAVVNQAQLKVLQAAVHTIHVADGKSVL